jgi:hypothetical protein
LAYPGKLKHLLSAALGFLLSLPVALLLAGFSAQWTYIHFIFERDLKDFAPGDAIGVFLLTWFHFAVLVIFTAILWFRLYKSWRRAADAACEQTRGLRI